VQILPGEAFSCTQITTYTTLKLIFYSLGMPSARKLLISLRAVVEYFKM
jgi:hypothetical protein